MKQKLVQTRPNTGVAFFTNSAESIAKLKEYTDAGKIVKSESMSEDQLVKTTELVYTAVDDYNDFIQEEVGLTEKNNRETYSSANGISTVLTEEE